MSIGEFDLVEQIRRLASDRPDVVLGIGDDAALVAPPPGMQLALSTDTLNSGVHFPAETAPFAIGWKALAVNLSDMAAMGAIPAWCTLSLALPDADSLWLSEFMRGFGTLARRHQVALAGGDTTRGPLSIGVHIIGFVPPGLALRRDAAQVGDDIWVSGHLGDAAAALSLWRADQAIPDALRSRLECPTPRIALGQALRGIAHAALDISDGLLADLGHICAASQLGAEVHLENLPTSSALLALTVDTDTRLQWQASGGDDYELCFTAAPCQRTAIARLADTLALPLTRIGQIQATPSIRPFYRNHPWQPRQAGHEHFCEDKSDACKAPLR